MLQKDDKTRQMVYYQSGIGTYTGKDNTASTLRSKYEMNHRSLPNVLRALYSISKTWDSAVAWSVCLYAKRGLQLRRLQEP